MSSTSIVPVLLVLNLKESAILFDFVVKYFFIADLLLLYSNSIYF